ncbi:putative cytoplasm protein [Wallemia mellicola]|uniref:Cytoplasm protein n=1 Tax=Wallemia mellicola TaxID=1708541 RepID=A0A4T0MX27_9BASI|nr:putative cytoplasm protein [Wallemia mellicola]TIB88500.1 putative cytoplasm protein [Wallemia mellicola]TIB90866.1 putative cytoplasm protein [Wallemia mellicola]TIC17813.1 putative cytoplasm protein [Wallemia mellicola]TIC23493.1 putative cytoplasm protein [Wallemia mellicola]
MAKSIVVIGGGIVGSSTAYYLSKHSGYTPGKDKITILESTSVASAASGKSGGFLAEDWHGPDTASLAELSFSLHKELADTYDGVNNWEYRPVNALSLLGQVGPKKGKLDESKKKGAHWLNDNIVDKCTVMGTPPSTAQVTPEALVKTLAEHSKADIVIASPVKISRDNDGKISSVRAETREGDNIEISATDIVLTAGPWTGRVAEKLLTPAEAKKCRVDGQRAHSIIVRPSQGRELSNHCLFTMVKERSTTHEPEIYCRPKGTAYICGAGDSVALPDDASQVVPSKSAIAELKAQSALISDYFNETMSVEKEQACYLPISSSHSPIIGKVSEGIYIGAGHSVWGITNGPGTDNDLNEDNPETLIAPGILEGRALSIDEDTLEPLTEGRHGLLYRCQRKIDDNIGGIQGWIALKAINVFINKKRLPHDALRESFILARTHHPNIISLLNAYESDRIYVLALPLQPLPLSMILSYPDFVPSFSPFSHIARSIIYQLLLAIEYLHSDEVGIAHRDVNPSNVAVDGNGCVKLLDFGVAFEYGCGMEDEHPNGGMYFELATGAYRAPELLFGSRAYDARSTDLWSLGVTLSTFFSHLTSYNCSTSPRTNSTSSISSSISTSSQGGLAVFPQSTESIAVVTQDTIRCITW